MIAAELTPIFNGMLALGLAIARIYPCVLLTPLFALSALKGMIRTAIVVPLALFVTPAIVPMLTDAPHTPWGIVAMMFKEVVLGIFLGYLLALPFWLFESVGVLFDNQRGALSGGQLNPALGADETPLGYMLLQWSMMVLIINFGLSLATQVIWDSYRLWPVDSWLPDFQEQGFLVFLGQVKQMFIDTILYAGPLVLLLLLLDFVVGVLSIYSPQLQATVLTVPLKCIAGLLFFIFYLPTLEYFAGHHFSALRDMIPHLADILPARQTTW